MTALQVASLAVALKEKIAAGGGSGRVSLGRAEDSGRLAGALPVTCSGNATLCSTMLGISTSRLTK